MSEWMGWQNTVAVSRSAGDQKAVRTGVEQGAWNYNLERLASARQAPPPNWVPQPPPPNSATCWERVQNISLWGHFVFKPSPGHSFGKENEEKGLSRLGGTRL